MSLTSYRISDYAKYSARLSGFDIDNPDQRHPVKNSQMEKVIAERIQQQGSRVPLLLKGRKTLDRFLNKERS